MHMEYYSAGLQVTSKTKKLQHTREIPSVELTCVGRGANSRVRGDVESKGAN